jgi:hypothetical protein
MRSLQERTLPVCAHAMRIALKSRVYTHICERANRDANGRPKGRKACEARPTVGLAVCSLHSTDEVLPYAVSDTH